MNVYTKRLDELVDSFLTEILGFDEFARLFSELYIEEVPDDALSDDATLWYGEIHEKFSWTAPDLQRQAQRDGWMMPDQFYGWLTRHVRARRLAGRF